MFVSWAPSVSLLWRPFLLTQIPVLSTHRYAQGVPTHRARQANYQNRKSLQSFLLNGKFIPKILVGDPEMGTWEIRSHPNLQNSPRFWHCPSSVQPYFGTWNLNPSDVDFLGICWSLVTETNVEVHGGTWTLALLLPGLGPDPFGQNTSSRVLGSCLCLV